MSKDITIKELEREAAEGDEFAKYILAKLSKLLKEAKE